MNEKTRNAKYEQDKSSASPFTAFVTQNQALQKYKIYTL